MALKCKVIDCNEEAILGKDHCPAHDLFKPNIKNQLEVQKGKPMYSEAKTKICIDCKEFFETRSYRKERCPGCQRNHKRKLNKEWMSKKRGNRENVRGKIPCPGCKEYIGAGSKKCKYCSFILRPEAVKLPKPPVKQKKNIVVTPKPEFKKSGDIEILKPGETIYVGEFDLIDKLIAECREAADRYQCLVVTLKTIEGVTGQSIEIPDIESVKEKPQSNKY